MAPDVMHVVQRVNLAVAPPANRKQPRANLVALRLQPPNPSLNLSPNSRHQGRASFSLAHAVGSRLARTLCRLWRATKQVGGGEFYCKIFWKYIGAGERRREALTPVPGIAYPGSDSDSCQGEKDAYCPCELSFLKLARSASVFFNLGGHHDAHI